MLVPLLLNLHYARQPEVRPWLGAAILSVSLLGVLALWMDRRRLRHGATPIAVTSALVVLAIYLRTLSPTTDVADSLEFQVVAHKLTLAHPPGYPLYTMLGKLFTLLPVRDIAYRMNLLSACSAAVAVGVTALIGAHLTGKTSAGLAAALTLAFTPAFWSLAVITEVYATHVLLVAVVLLGAMRWASAVRSGASGRGATRWLLAAVFAFGLGLTHHATIVFLAPALAGAVLVNEPRLLVSPRRLVGPAMALLAGLAPTLYLFARWPAVSGRPARVADVLGYATASPYTGLFRPTWPLEDPTRLLVLLRYELTSQFGAPFLLLAALGWVWLLARRTQWAMWLGMVWLLHVTFRAGYNAWDGWVTLLPSHLIVGVWVAAGMAAVEDRLGGSLRRARTALSLGAAGYQAAAGSARLAPDTAPRHCLPAVYWTLALLLPVCQLWNNGPACDRSQGWPPAALGRRILDAGLPAGASIVVEPQLGSALLYPQLIEGRRPDVRIMYADTPSARRILDGLPASGGPVYLWGVEPDPADGFYTRSIGPLVEVSSRPFDAVGRVPQGLAVALGGPGAGQAEDTLRDSAAGIASADESSVRRARPVQAVWPGRARLLGFEAPPSVRPGDEVRLALHWRWLSSATPERPVTLTVDAGPLGRDTGCAFANLRAGQVVTTRHTFRVPHELERKAGDKVPMQLSLREDGRLLPQRAAKSILVHPRPFVLPPIHVRVGTPGLAAPVTFADGIRLVGLAVPQSLCVGRRVLVGLVWESYAVPTHRVRASIQLLDPGLDRRSNEDRPILHGTRPTTGWRPGEQFHDLMPLSVPTDLTPGGYWLQVSLYDEATRRLLPVLDAHGAAVADQFRRSIAVVHERLAPIDHKASAHFGSELALQGYALSPTRTVGPGRPLTVTLRWMATAQPRRDYTLFVHLLRLGEDGREVLVAQHDGQPFDGALPTSAWPLNQPLDIAVVLQPSAGAIGDPPHGRLRLAIGWYDLATGVRLPVTGPPGSADRDRFLLEVGGQ